MIKSPFKATYQDDLMREVIVVNFAGGGGSCVGIEQALGRPVDYAVNHDPAAIAMHAVNHPLTTHFQEDVFAIDPVKATEGRPVGLGWFSPGCTFFSKARGGKPVNKKIRGLAWVTLRWAMSAVSPRVIMLENVEEFREWGPCIEVVKKGEKVFVPDPARKAETFNGFVAMLTKGLPKTHPAFLEACEFLKLDPESAEAGRLSRGLGYRVEWRILKACDYDTPTSRKRFYLIARRDGKPIVFPAPTNGKGAGLKPYRTAAECIDFTVPVPSIFERKKPLVVNTLKRIARGMRKFVLENPKPFIVEFNFENTPQDIDKPLTTATTVGHHYVVNPSVVPIGYGERKGQNPRVNDVKEPLSTIVSTCKQNLAAPYLTQYHAEKQEGEARGQCAKEPLRTVDRANRYGMTAAYLTKYFSGEQQAGASLEEPQPTVTGIDHSALVASHIVHYYGGDDHASAPNDPLPTVTAKPRHYLVNHHLCILRKNMDGKSVDEPMPTITSKAAHHADVAVYLEKIDTTQDLGYWSEVRDLLNAYAGFDFKIAEDEIIIIEIDGEKYFISDIGMRMLEPRELALAMGMPSDYVIDIEPYIGKPYSKAKQIARIGNMVCAPVAEALVRANCADMAVDYARNGGRADTMEELHRVFSGHRPRDRRPARVAV